MFTYTTLSNFWSFFYIGKYIKNILDKKIYYLIIKKTNISEFKKHEWRTQEHTVKLMRALIGLLHYNF